MTTHFIAIVVRDVNTTAPLKRTSFTGATKDEAIRAALAERETWQKPGYGPYRIFVGELTEEVVTPVEYSLKQLE
jgi:hypothetical protein